MYSGSRETSYLITSIDNETLEQQVRNLGTEIDSRLDVVQISTLDDVFNELRKRHLTAAWIAIVLASVSFVMVCIGINGIVSYMVQIRRYDLGVRLAMGAGERRLLKESLAELMQPVMMSLIFAFLFMLIGYCKSSRALAFNVNWNVVIFTLICFSLLSMLVCFFPIRKILMGDPVKALRNE